MSTTEQDTERAEYVQALRDVADFLERHPEFPAPLSATMGAHTFDTDVFVAAVKALGTATKDFTHPTIAAVRRAFGPIQLMIQANRDQVCERIVIGTTTVEVEEPDPEAVAALPKVRRTETVEQVEWRCAPILSKATA